MDFFPPPQQKQQPQQPSSAPPSSSSNPATPQRNKGAGNSNNSNSLNRLSTPPSSSRRSAGAGGNNPGGGGGGGGGGGSGIYSDRFIPSRTTTNLEEAFNLLSPATNDHNSNSNNNNNNGNDISPLNPSSSTTPMGGMTTTTTATRPFASSTIAPTTSTMAGSGMIDPSSTSSPHESQVLMNHLLRSELLGQSSLLSHNPHHSSTGVGGGGGIGGLGGGDHLTSLDLRGISTSDSSTASHLMMKSPSRHRGGDPSTSSLFKYRVSTGSNTTGDSPSSSLGGGGGDGRSSVGGGGDGLDSPRRFSSSTNSSSMIGISPKKPARKIPKTPFKVLDAPSLQDDYYLNLVDWSSSNILSVALCSSVYLWSACTSKVTRLCDFGSSDMVTSISWALTGNQIAVGLNSGKIQIWDSTTCKVIRELQSHESRVGSLAWNSTLLASGSRDRAIFLQDIRIRNTHRTPLSASRPTNNTTTTTTNSNTNNNNPTAAPAAAASSNSLIDLLPPTLTFPEGIDVSSPMFPPQIPQDRPFMESLLALNDTTASRSDDTFPFTDPLSNIPMTTSSPNRYGRTSDPLSSLLHADFGASSTFRDFSTGGCVVREYNVHKQEVCGLKWSFDEKLLASGGNDNKLYVWDPIVSNSRRNEPVCRFEDHTAAVKAVAWSPHQQGLLASGGGTADRHIRFWNATTNTALHKVDTGSQVCNLMWSKTVNEIVSTHGYSLNQVIIWKYPTMQKLATLSGHTLRVLYLAMSPDGQTIVTGAGDETLRFWNVFPAPRNKSGFPAGKSLLTPSGSDIR